MLATCDLRLRSATHRHRVRWWVLHSTDYVFYTGWLFLTTDGGVVHAFELQFPSCIWRAVFFQKFSSHRQARWQVTSSGHNSWLTRLCICQKTVRYLPSFESLCVIIDIKRGIIWTCMSRERTNAEFAVPSHVICITLFTVRAEACRMMSYVCHRLLHGGVYTSGLPVGLSCRLLGLSDNLSMWNISDCRSDIPDK